MWPCVAVCGVGLVCLCLLRGPVCCGAVPRPRGVWGLRPPTQKGRPDGEGTVWEHQASASLSQGDSRGTLPSELMRLLEGCVRPRTEEGLGAAVHTHAHTRSL